MSKTSPTNARKELLEARMMITSLARVCRQSVVYLQGKSCMDETRMKQTINRAVTDAEKYLNRNA